MLSTDGDVFPVYEADYVQTIQTDDSAVKFVRLQYPDLTEDMLSFLKDRNDVVVLLSSEHPDGENNVGWRIDYFYVSEDLKNFVKDAYILDDIFGSDHCPIGLEIEI